MEADSTSQLEKKRERENKISKIMAEYLLKGYTMLGSTCNVCRTILLKDRQQKDYCIGCSEIDSLSAFIDVPQKKIPQTVQDEPQSAHERSPEIENHHENDVASNTRETMTNTHRATPLIDCEDTHLTSFDQAILKLQDRLMWAINQLGVANSVEMDIKLCELISSCGNAIRTLKELQHQNVVRHKTV